MRSVDVGSRANEAARNFIASLDVPASKREGAIIFNAYAAGWIQGAYAGANEARPDVCSRRTTGRNRPTCTHYARG